MYSLLKTSLKTAFDLKYRTGLIDNAGLASLGGKAIFFASNVSAIDPLLMMAYVPGRPVFAVSKEMYVGRVKRFLKHGDVFVINHSDPESLKELIRALNSGRQAVIFAEGALCENGLPTKYQDSIRVLLEGTKAPLVPVRFKGAEMICSSRLKDNPKYYRGKLDVIFFPVCKAEDVLGDSAKQTEENLYKIMRDAFYETWLDREASVFATIVNSMRLYGDKKKDQLEDSNRVQISLKTCLLKTNALAGAFEDFTQQGEAVGVMLPNSLANLCTILALTSRERLPAMINFSSGERNILHCCKTAQINTIITAHKFINLAELGPLVETLKKEGLRIIYLEDVAAGIKLPGKLKALWNAKRYHVPHPKGGKDKRFVILFTSGSEGMPKAVVLSHYNFISNEVQAITELACLSPKDVCFNALPMFHSFGLLFTILPMLNGCRLFLYPTPLHYKIIPELCYSIGATIVTGTDTFLKNYAKAAHPSDFRSLRVVVCGAEKLREDTRAIWDEKFGLRIIQGYGATEASPVITVNTFARNRTGSIGRMLPGIQYKIKPVEGVKAGGELVIKGDNVMMGYMKFDKPGVIQPPADGWYDTGDVVEVDEDGFFFITDRLKRFAKLAGEMVSLTSVENLVKGAFANDGDLGVGAVAVPDDVKGERIVLVSTNKNLDLSRVSEYAKAQKVSELYVPKVHMYMEEIPVLKTGKTDLITLKEKVLEAVASKKD